MKEDLEKDLVAGFNKILVISVSFKYTDDIRGVSRGFINFHWTREDLIITLLVIEDCKRTMIRKHAQLRRFLMPAH